VTEHPGEQFPPAVDPDVEPQPDERRTPDYDTEPEPETSPYADQADAVDPDVPEEPLEPDDTEQAFAASLENEQPLETLSEDQAEAVLEDGRSVEVDEGEGAGQEAPVASAGPFVPKPGPPASFQPRPGPPAGFSPRPAAPTGSSPRPAAPISQVESAGVGEQADYRDDGVHPLVEETMERLDGLRERPVSEHAEVYADLHERLQTALVEADAEHGDRG
jgi:hypothetical protein